MRIYELIIVLKPQLSDNEIADFVEKTKKLIAHDGGSVVFEEKWGRRKLAHPIGHAREGFYVFLKINAAPSAVEKLDRNFKVQDSVLRTMSVRVAETEKAPAK